MERRKKMMNSEILSVLLVLSINLVATFTYLFFLADENRKKAFFCLPALLQKAFVALFVGPLFISPFMPQSRFPGLPEAINITLSLLLVFIGIVFILGAFFKIGLMTIFEERSLINEYGQEYKDYQLDVRKRIIPFVI
jgi:protein-S-isoprenylcysteine O-methyltransferase Ste14